MASCSASSRLASRVLQRPFSSGMLHRKKIIPPKHTHHQCRHWLGASAAAVCTAAAWAFRTTNTLGGTPASAFSCAPSGAIVFSWVEYLDMAASCVEYGAMVCRSDAYGTTVARAGAAAITPVMAALLLLMVVRIPTPFAPPPAAAIAWASRAGGILDGLV